MTSQWSAITADLLDKTGIGCSYRKEKSGLATRDYLCLSYNSGITLAKIVTYSSQKLCWHIRWCFICACMNVTTQLEWATFLIYNAILFTCYVHTSMWSRIQFTVTFWHFLFKIVAVSIVEFWWLLLFWSIAM